MKFPRISIVTPSLNQGKYLERTILSIINQNYPNLEYFIIDGGSTDGSVDIIKKYENKINYWVSEDDTGQSHAINKGLSRATGDIITWINSDDQLLPGALKKVVKYFELNHNIGLIHGKTILYDNEGFSEIRGADPNNLVSRYLSGMPFPQPSSFFRNDVIVKYGLLDQKLHFGMDYDLLCRIVLNYDILMVDDIFSNYLLHKNSKSETSHAEFAKDWMKVFSKLIRTIDASHWILEEMKILELYVSTDEEFTVSKKFSDDEIQKAFLFFLINQIIFNYQALNLRKTAQLTDYLRKNYRKFYDENNLSQVYWRSKYAFFGSIIRVYRKNKKVR